MALTCRVVRDGLEQTVPASAIVPGDVIVLSPGNLVPADGLVIEAEYFLVNEGTLTDESFPSRSGPRISLLTELAVVLVLRTHRPAFRSRPSSVLLWATVGSQ